MRWGAKQISHLGPSPVRAEVTGTCDTNLELPDARHERPSSPSKDSFDVPITFVRSRMMRLRSLLVSS